MITAKVESNRFQSLEWLPMGNRLPACVARITGWKPKPLFVSCFVMMVCVCQPLRAAQVESEADQRVIVVVGAAGADEYSGQFSEWAAHWQQSASHARCTVIGTESAEVDDKKSLHNTIRELEANTVTGEVWLVMIGHGTYDGQRAKFNLRGPDVEASELKAWLLPLKQRLVVINCASSSSPFINELSGANRIIVTATKDGHQYNFSRFAQFMAASINDPAIDLDKDGQTSVLEAFCSASQSVQGFYDQENRLATEHALIDDNGDGLGTPAEWFEGTRANRNPKQGIADGIAANQVFLQRRGVDATLTAEQRTKRNELETKLERLRVNKSRMTEDQYLLEIEPILIELAKLYGDGRATRQ